MSVHYGVFSDPSSDKCPVCQYPLLPIGPQDAVDWEELPDRTLRLYVPTCGHLMHQDCAVRYVDSWRTHHDDSSPPKCATCRALSINPAEFAHVPNLEEVRAAAAADRRRAEEEEGARTAMMLQAQEMRAAGRSAAMNREDLEGIRQEIREELWHDNRLREEIREERYADLVGGPETLARIRNEMRAQLKRDREFLAEVADAHFIKDHYNQKWTAHNKKYEKDRYDQFKIVREHSRKFCSEYPTLDQRITRVDELVLRRQTSDDPLSTTAWKALTHDDAKYPPFCFGWYLVEDPLVVCVIAYMLKVEPEYNIGDVKLSHGDQILRMASKPTAELMQAIQAANYVDREFWIYLGS